jgi:hypothetical protein
MRQCPVCRRAYTDETVVFCLDDGTRLTSGYDPQATLIIPDSRLTSTAPTIDATSPASPLHHASSLHGSPLHTSPLRASAPQVVRRGVSPGIVYGLVALLALVIGGGVVALLYERGKNDGASDDNRGARAPLASPTATTQTGTGDNPKPADRPTPERTPTPGNTGGALPGRYPEASTRLLETSDVMNKSAWELKIMKNEIYARHGYIFKTPELKSYFESQSWYEPLYDNVDDLLSQTERENAAFIKGYE